MRYVLIRALHNLFTMGYLMSALRKDTFCLLVIVHQGYVIL